MDSTIRSLSAEEAAPVFNWLEGYAFLSSPPLPDSKPLAERLSHVEGYTNFLAFYEGDTPTACAASGPMTQNIRGTIVDMAGVFMVATHPQHRRKGHSFQLLTELLSQMRERGNGFSCLYPFRESFYERLGYANLPGMIKAEINIRALQPLLKQTYQSTLELVEFIQQPDAYYDCVRLLQQRTHGTATFKKQYPPDPNRHKAWVLTSHLNGKPDGMLVYTLKSDHGPTLLKMTVSRFYPFSADTRYHFLEWFARHIDQASEVTINLPPYEQPTTWFSDMQVSLGTQGLSPMGRVLDIEKMNGINVGEGTFSVEILDPTCPWNEGSWKFEGQSGKLKVTKTKQAGHQLTIQGLSALVYGSLAPGSFRYRGWGAFPESMEKSMQNLFPQKTPYLHESF